MSTIARFTKISGKHNVIRKAQRALIRVCIIVMESSIIQKKKMRCKDEEIEIALDGQPKRPTREKRGWLDYAWYSVIMDPPGSSTRRDLSLVDRLNTALWQSLSALLRVDRPGSVEDHTVCSDTRSIDQLLFTAPSQSSNSRCCCYSDASPETEQYYVPQCYHGGIGV